MKYVLCWTSPNGVNGRGKPISRRLADKMLAVFVKEEKSKDPPFPGESDLRGYRHWIERIEPVSDESG